MKGAVFWSIKRVVVSQYFHFWSLETCWHCCMSWVAGWLIMCVSIFSYYFQQWISFGKNKKKSHSESWRFQWGKGTDINISSCQQPLSAGTDEFSPAEKKFLLFTLGGVYSTNASGAKKILETHNLNQT